MKTKSFSTDPRQLTLTNLVADDSFMPHVDVALRAQIENCISKHRD